MCAPLCTYFAIRKRECVRAERAAFLGGARARLVSLRRNNLQGRFWSLSRRSRTTEIPSRRRPSRVSRPRAHALSRSCERERYATRVSRQDMLCARERERLVQFLYQRACVCVRVKRENWFVSFLFFSISKRKRTAGTKENPILARFRRPLAPPPFALFVERKKNELAKTQKARKPIARCPPPSTSARSATRTPTRVGRVYLARDEI